VFLGWLEDQELAPGKPATIEPMLVTDGQYFVFMKDLCAVLHRNMHRKASVDISSRVAGDYYGPMRWTSLDRVADDHAAVKRYCANRSTRFDLSAYIGLALDGTHLKAGVATFEIQPGEEGNDGSVVPPKLPPAGHAEIVSAEAIASNRSSEGNAVAFGRKVSFVIIRIGTFSMPLSRSPLRPRYSCCRSAKAWML
jgi:hypothetical protein